jgi:hypothetical protein
VLTELALPEMNRGLTRGGIKGTRWSQLTGSWSIRDVEASVLDCLPDGKERQTSRVVNGYTLGKNGYMDGMG